MALGTTGANLRPFGYFTHCPQLNLSDPEATARIFVGAIVHFMIVQEMLHGKDIMPMERDRIIDGLIDLIVEEQSFNDY
jgi:TetR/AcrR family transcriptional regulator, regulator of autoinduction and epiphytic fitness